MQHHICANIGRLCEMFVMTAGPKAERRSVLYYATGKTAFAAAHYLQQNPPIRKLMHNFIPEI